MRTSGPALPSGRSAASTGQMVPSAVWSEQARIRWPASWVATRAATCSSTPSAGSKHEDDVDVGDVVELVGAALAQRDHREPGGGRRLAHPLPRDRQRRLERPGGEVGQLGRGVVDALVVGQVAGGEPQQQPAVLHPQRVERLAVRQRRDGLVRRPGRRPRPAPAGRVRRTRVPGSSPASGRSARASGRGAAPGGRPARRSPPARTAAASRCPRRRPPRPAAPRGPSWPRPAAAGWTGPGRGPPYAPAAGAAGRRGRRAPPASARRGRCR